MRALERCGSSASKARSGERVGGGTSRYGILGGVFPAKALMVLLVGGVPTWKADSVGEETCWSELELDDESRFASSAARSWASCNARPSSALILCFILAEYESGSVGSLCRKRSASIAFPSSGESFSGKSRSINRGIAGTAGAGALSESSSPQPVCDRWSGLGRKSSSSSRVGGRSGTFLIEMGDRLLLSES